MSVTVPFVVGVAGWKNSGKTTLVTRLVTELVRRGYRVATIKHSHHEIEAEREGSDSFRHREAGAHQVAVISPAGWAIVDPDGTLALEDDPDPPLASVIARFDTADIVIVEGMKRAAIPKIETRRREQGPGEPLATADKNVFAVASAEKTGSESAGAGSYALDDVHALTETLLRRAGLPQRKETPR